MNDPYRKSKYYIQVLPFCFMQFEYLKPMRAGEILDASVKLYRRNFTLLVAAQLPMTIFYLLLAVMQMYFLGTAPASLFSFIQPEAVSIEPEFALSWILVVYTLLLFQTVLIKPLVLSATTRIASDSILDVPSVKKGFQFFFQNWWRLILTYVIPTILLGLVFGLLGLFCGIGIVLAIFLGIRWLLAFPVAANDNIFMLRSLDRSWNLVKGQTWNTFLVMAVVCLIPFILQLSPAFVELLLEKSISPLIIVFGVLSEGLIVPLIDTTRVVMYFQLRARKEGFDLEKRVEALEDTEYHE